MNYQQLTISISIAIDTPDIEVAINVSIVKAFVSVAIYIAILKAKVPITSNKLLSWQWDAKTATMRNLKYPLVSVEVTISATFINVAILVAIGGAYRMRNIIDKL